MQSKQVPSGYFLAENCILDEFKQLINQNVDHKTVPNADDVQNNIPIYDISKLSPKLLDPTTKTEVMAEWANVLLLGAGVLALKGAYTDTSPIDDATRVFENIIATEKQTNSKSGDHFAASGANDRIWNSLQKLCMDSPDTYLKYFANTALDCICEAWLGPNYQMTSQVNLVHPGGAAQLAHRDFHLGFQTAEVSATYPSHVHDLSPALTLQGAIAHCDMPIESGPTKLLPFSQLYRQGYAAWRLDDFRELFEQRYVQLPLSKGDAVFFNPALFHAAGANSSADIHRMVNLLQVSSAFGRTMETIDRAEMCRTLYPHALKAKQDNTLADMEINAVINATAEGYSFPTNLDRNPPKGGLAPETQQAYFARALKEGITAADFNKHLDEMVTNDLP